MAETLTAETLETLAPPAPATVSALPCLGQGHTGLKGAVAAIQAASAELERLLLEIGFIEGAEVEVLHEGPFGRDPIAVRVDDMRVALRRREAAAILIHPASRTEAVR